MTDLRSHPHPVLVAFSMLLASLLLIAADPPAAGAACGTAWASKREPPETIRVLRTATNQVEEVGFKKYVAVVMASGEWPSSLPKALLEAGALATKQYGWYYALEGNHRDGYETSGGVCYDVIDDSSDQVYRPESAEPTDEQKAARDALWGLSLRKNDKFFLTGYRQGSASTCAQDHDEWKLYATSAEDCATRLEYDSIEILHAYYSPKLTDVWAPGTGPDADDQAPDDESELPSAEPAGDPSADEEPEPEASADDGSTGPIGSLIDEITSLFEGDRDE